MRLSLNLDKYLREFPALQFCQQILEEYYTSLGETDKSVKVDGDSYYFSIDDSNDYYEELLKSRYPIVYTLINELITPSLTRDSEEYSMHWKDWYYVAQNAYMMKGGIESVYYIFTYLGIDIYHDPESEDTLVFYDKNYLRMTLAVQMETNHPDIVKANLYELCSDLLLIQESHIDVTVLYIDYLLQNTTYFFVNAYTNRIVKADENLLIGKVHDPSVYLYYQKLSQYSTSRDYHFGNGLPISSDTVDLMHNYAVFQLKNMEQPVMPFGTDNYSDYYIPEFYEKLYRVPKKDNPGTETLSELRNGHYKNRFEISIPRVVSVSNRNANLTLQEYIPEFYKVHAGLLDLNYIDIKRPLVRRVMIDLETTHPTFRRLLSGKPTQSNQSHKPETSIKIVNLVPTFLPE